MFAATSSTPAPAIVGHVPGAGRSDRRAARISTRCQQQRRAARDNQRPQAGRGPRLLEEDEEETETQSRSQRVEQTTVLEPGARSNGAAVGIGSGRHERHRTECEDHADRGKGRRPFARQ